LHDLVGDRLDLRQLVMAHRLAVRKVEAQSLRLDQRPLLSDMAAENMPQRLMNEMGRRMMLPIGGTPRVIDDQFHRFALLEAACFKLTDMSNDIAGALLRVGNAKKRTLGSLDDAAV